MRRKTTVMFCDLMGPTALSSECEPEDYRGKGIAAFNEKCTPRFTGT